MEASANAAQEQAEEVQKRCASLEASANAAQEQAEAAKKRCAFLEAMTAARGAEELAKAAAEKAAAAEGQQAKVARDRAPAGPCKARPGGANWPCNSRTGASRPGCPFPPVGRHSWTTRCPSLMFGTCKPLIRAVQVTS